MALQRNRSQTLLAVPLRYQEETTAWDRQPSLVPPTQSRTSYHHYCFEYLVEIRGDRQSVVCCLSQLVWHRSQMQLTTARLLAWGSKELAACRQSRSQNRHHHRRSYCYCFAMALSWCFLPYRRSLFVRGIWAHLF